MISSEGKLVGVGSLIVGDAAGGSEKTPGNMFVPIDRLPPILGDLIADGRVAGPGRPWLGVNADELHGRLFVGRVTPGGPADKAGIKRGEDGAASHRCGTPASCERWPKIGATSRSEKSITATTRIVVAKPVAATSDRGRNACTIGNTAPTRTVQPSAW